MSLLLQTWAAWHISAATGHVPGPGASLAVCEGTFLVSGAHPAFALAVLQHPTALPPEILTRPQWTVYTVGGLTAQASLPVTPLQHHTGVLFAMAAAAPAAPPPFDVVQASMPDTIAGQSLAWMPTATVPPAVRILGLSPPLRPWVSIVLAFMLRATRWQAVSLPGPLVVPLAPRSHHDNDGAVVVTCSADITPPPPMPMDPPCQCPPHPLSKEETWPPLLMDPPSRKKKHGPPPQIFSPNRTRIALFLPTFLSVTLCVSCLILHLALLSQNLTIAVPQSR